MRYKLTLLYIVVHVTFSSVPWSIIWVLKVFGLEKTPSLYEGAAGSLVVV